MCSYCRAKGLIKQAEKRSLLRFGAKSQSTITAAPAKSSRKPNYSHTASRNSHLWLEAEKKIQKWLYFSLQSLRTSVWGSAESSYDPERHTGQTQEADQLYNNRSLTLLYSVCKRGDSTMCLRTSMKTANTEQTLLQDKTSNSLTRTWRKPGLRNDRKRHSKFVTKEDKTPCRDQKLDLNPEETGLQIQRVHLLS